MTRAAIYCRVSTPEQEKHGHSLGWQKTELPKRAIEAGRVVDADDIFVEVQSGSKDDRPEYNRLMARIVEGMYQEVWVVETSRLSRTEDRGEVQRVINALQMFGCVIRTLNGTYDVSTFEGEFIYDIDSSVNRLERKRIKKRLTDGRMSKIKKGGFFGHTPPTGYKLVRDLNTGKMRFLMDEDEIRPVKTAFDLALKGAGSVRIVKELTKQGYKTKTGNNLSITHVFQWLMNPAYAGFAHLGMSRGSKAKAKVMERADYIDETIISFEQWEMVQDLLESRKHKKKTGTYPLSGILRCASCGDKMTGTYKPAARGGTIKYYVCIPTGSEVERYCPNTQGRSIKMTTVHELFLKALPEILDAANHGFQDMVDQYNSYKEEKDESASEMQRHQKRLDQLKKRIMLQYSEWEEDQSEFRLERIKILEAEAEELKSTLQQLKSKRVAPPLMLNLEELREMSEHLDPSEMGILDEITKTVLTSLNFSRTGTHRKYTFKLTSCTLKNGQIHRFKGDYSFSQ